LSAKAPQLSSVKEEQCSQEQSLETTRSHFPEFKIEIATVQRVSKAEGSGTGTELL
jgi:hypothetical protein